MASKACNMKLSVYAYNILTRSNHMPHSLNGISQLRHFSQSITQGPCLGGASLLSLPGNRLLASVVSSPAIMSTRWRGTRKADTQISMNVGVVGIEHLEDFTPLADESSQKGVAQQINQCLEQGEAGRLYAVVYIRGIQHKITTGDIIAVKYDFPPNVGDQLRLEKVLAVGGKDFSLIGQPLLSRSQVRVEATVVEKTLTHNRVWFVYRKRRNFKTFHLYREMMTILAINSIQVAKVPGASQQQERLQEEDSVQ